MAQIRKAEPEDLEQIHALFFQERGRPPTAPVTIEWLEEYPSVVAHEGDELVGFAYTKKFGPDVLEVANILVAARWRDQGIGAVLLDEIELQAVVDFRAIIVVNSLGYPGKEGGRLAGKFYERAGYIRAIDTGISLVFIKMLARVITRQGSVAEVLATRGLIPELGQSGEDERHLTRLDGREHLVLVAEDAQGRVVGFKIGYALADKVFYSWLGGVVPQARHKGVATKLLNAQESWAVDKGYEKIRVKSMNRYSGMLQFLIENGYMIVGTEGSGGAIKIVFEKDLEPLRAG